jgi:hypothetical protein
MNLTNQLIPIVLVYLVLQAPLVVFAGWFAPKMGARMPLWIGLTAIPWIGLLFGYALMLRAFGALLDALKTRNQLLRDQHLERRLSITSIETQASEMTAPFVQDSASRFQIVA